MTQSAIHAPINTILPSFVPVFFERGILGYEAASLVPNESRIAHEPLRALVIASAFFGALNHTSEHGLDFKRVKETLIQSIYNIDDVTVNEAQLAIDLINRFFAFQIIREKNSFDDWLCEALWPALQSQPYVYPSAMSDVITYGLSINKSLQKCIVDY